MRFSSQSRTYRFFLCGELIAFPQWTRWFSKRECNAECVKNNSASDQRKENQVRRCETVIQLSQPDQPRA
jgi:hypothetical protein